MILVNKFISSNRKYLLNRKLKISFVMRVYFDMIIRHLMCLIICMFTYNAVFSSVLDVKGRENLFVEEKGQNADPEYLKFSWKGNRLFAYFCIDKVTFVVQEVTYVDNEASIDARRKGQAWHAAECVRTSYRRDAAPASTGGIGSGNAARTEQPLP